MVAFGPGTIMRVYAVALTIDLLLQKSYWKSFAHACGPCPTSQIISELHAVPEQCELCALLNPLMIDIRLRV